MVLAIEENRTILEDLLCNKCPLYKAHCRINNHCEAFKALGRLLTREGVQVFADILAGD